MGNWNINIQGVGCHHNGIQSDADQMAKKFAEELKAAGHSVEAATFTSGSKTSIMPESKPPAN